MNVNEWQGVAQTTTASLPPQAICEDVLLEKYARDGERNAHDVRRRVARALAAVERQEDRTGWEERFYHAQAAGFIAGGRINSAAGTGLQATLINGFVQPVGDSIAGSNGERGNYDALREAAQTMRITTYRPNGVTGSVLEVAAPDLDGSDPDRRIRLEKAPQPPLASLRWPGRPQLPDGNPCWTYAVRHPLGNFAVVIGHIDNGQPQVFEVWVNGAEQPRALGAIAKTLSMDMRAADRQWLELKLKALEKASGDDAFEMAMPPRGEPVQVPSLVSGFAKLVRYRCNALGAFGEAGPSPVVDALIGLKEPKAGPDGTLSWTVDVLNASTGDDFALFLKELVMPDGQRRPYSMWLAGAYPRVLDGLCKALSLDMRVCDVAWIGMKLRKLLNYGEANGSFLARVPGSAKAQLWPSTIAYLARLMIHRYAMLGLLTEEGHPVANAGILALPAQGQGGGERKPLAGRRCPECANANLIRRDGCDFCTACGHVGACG